MPARFGNPEALAKRREFLRVQTGGRRFKCGYMVLIVASGETERARVGFTVSRKVGNAVIRNRVRRRLREIVRQHPELLCDGIDHVVVAFNTAATADFATLRDELICLLERARNWASSKAS